MKVARLDDGRLWFDCPGCGFMHAVSVDNAAGQGPRWNWNLSLEKPTFQPSILVTWTWGESREPKSCHSYVTDGHIRFLNDCTHEFAGQTVELPEVET